MADVASETVTTSLASIAVLGDASMSSKPRRRIGILTPASNTNLEPITGAMLQSLPHVSAHFSRFALPASFETPIRAVDLWPAAQLLAEIEPDIVVLHGTSGSWTGPDGDRMLAEDLSSKLGCTVTTATLATLDALRALGAREIGVAFPGPLAIADQIVTAYAREGLNCCSRASGGLGENTSIGAMQADEIRELVSRTCAPGLDAVAIIGTNIRAAPIVASLEEEFGMLIVDSTVATTWQVLRLIGEIQPIVGWGHLLEVAL